MIHYFIMRLKKSAAVFFAVFFVVMLCLTALAQDDAPRVLRVAFPQVEGFSITEEDGSRRGLVVDYLNEISKYTGWEYEYIDTTGDVMIDEFMDGRFDLMGGNYYQPGFEQYFAYPDYNTGYSRAVLLARGDDSSIKSYDLESMNGKTIGVYAPAMENIRRLKEFLAINNLNCNIQVYSIADMGKDANLYRFLEGGEVDLLLGNSLETVGNLRIVASFDSQPYYIVTTVGNQEILDGLNMALEKIMDSNPNFSAERYAANFPDRLTVDIQLNQEEKEYIQQKRTVTVAIAEEWHPLFCMNTPGDLHNGIVPEILEEISRFTGLTFTYRYTESYIDAIHMVQQGEADILGFFLGSEEEAAQQGLALSSAYVTLNSIVVRNKASTYPDEGLVGAIVDGRLMPRDVFAQHVQVYASITEALSAVNQGEADFIYGLSARLEQDIQRHHFSNLVPMALVNDRSNIGFALPRPADPNLLTVLNKAINNLSATKKGEILDRNLISMGTSRLSLIEMIYANPVMFVCVLAFVLLILVMAVLLVTRARLRAAVIQSNLEKAEAESRAKGEFLSRMSHEIRTPMNAVVGLADLTSMIDGVPDHVRDNLTKIRSSSHYLLSLINDILDMSRIESGMMTIASEAFSLGQVLSDLQSMMEAEAQRRSLTFTLENELVHSELVGDAIRLRQVLTNLLSNAFKFTPAGGTVLLRAMENESSEADATLTFQVIDSGVGIRPEDQERIFASFEQLGLNYSKSQGTGLGLAISRNIVRLMGGELCVRSEPGCGSEFYFTITLPLGRMEEEPEGLEASDLLHGVRILLAEDNDLNAEIAIELLEIQGASVTRSETGRQVVERFERSVPGEFQVILMDIQMPEMNGLEATRAIRALTRPDAALIPIVAMTANSFQEDADAATAAGMNGFVSKPLDVSYLYSLLRELLSHEPSLP